MVKNDVIELLNFYYELSYIDKLRLSINLLESKYFNVSIDKNGIISVLERLLNKLDKKNKARIVNFNKYPTLTFLSAKFIELSENDKKVSIYYILINIYKSINVKNQFLITHLKKEGEH